MQRWSRSAWQRSRSWRLVEGQGLSACQLRAYSTATIVLMSVPSVLALGARRRCTQSDRGQLLKQSNACAALAPPRQEREERRAEERKKGAVVLLEQLAEREQQRIRTEQLRRIEGEEMARRIEALKLEEAQVSLHGRQPGAGLWGPQS